MNCCQRERIFGSAHRDEVVLRCSRRRSGCVCARDRRVRDRDGQSGELLVDLYGEDVRFCPDSIRLEQQEAHLFVAELFGKASCMRPAALLLPFTEPPDSRSDESKHDDDDHKDDPPRKVPLLVLIDCSGRSGGDGDEVFEADAEAGYDAAGFRRRSFRRTACSAAELLPRRTRKARRGTAAGAGGAA